VPHALHPQYRCEFPIAWPSHWPSAKTCERVSERAEVACSRSVKHLKLARALFCPSSCQYDAQTKEIEDRFRDFGDIKSFFDLIGTRGMIFVNFVSPRRRRLEVGRLCKPGNLTPASNSQTPDSLTFAPPSKQRPTSRAWSSRVGR
jgi:hypothetical protein